MRKPLYDHIQIDRPLSEVEIILTGDPTTWLPDPGKPVGGDLWVVDLHAEGAVLAATSRVPATVHVGASRRLADGKTIVRPITWRGDEAPTSYPTFEGEVEVTPLSATACQLSVFGSYVPPFGPLGGAFDVALGHRVAEVVLRNFCVDLGHRLGTVTLAR